MSEGMAGVRKLQKLQRMPVFAFSELAVCLWGQAALTGGAWAISAPGSEALPASLGPHSSCSTGCQIPWILFPKFWNWLCFPHLTAARLYKAITDYNSLDSSNLLLINLQSSHGSGHISPLLEIPSWFFIYVQVGPDSSAHHPGPNFLFHGCPPLNLWC